MPQFFRVYYTVLARIHDLYCSRITSYEYLILKEEDIEMKRNFAHERIADYKLTLECSFMKYDTITTRAINSNS